jgi:hypothetical protein
LTDVVLLYLVVKLLLRVPLPEQAHILHLLDKGIESLVWRLLVQSPMWGGVGFRLSLREGERPSKLGTMH